MTICWAKRWGVLDDITGDDDGNSGAADDDDNGDGDIYWRWRWKLNWFFDDGI